ncbi:glycosyltransferase [Thiorhodococcus mannitoliphagus]|uniref:Glycosyltransferase n=1 Tax=Thiorhodococcus mannitoliphagus TaxID=329406 RepID=A0A6P1DW43_9GAMM|nr:glycosyltransferase [Thiorhodococcus mannitoliphagus]
MARILFSTMGSLGDLYPYIAVAKHLLQRGHGAVIVTNGEHRASVERAGVEFVETAPIANLQGDYQAAAERMLAARGGEEFLVRELVMPQLRETHQVMMEAARGVDLLVSQTFGMTASIVAEQRGLPWVATLLAPISFMSTYDPPLIPAAAWLFGFRRLGPKFHRAAFARARKQVFTWEAPLHALRRELGVSALAGPALFDGQYSPYLNLALFDRVLAAPQPDWPAGTEITGSPVYDGEADPAQLADFRGFLAEGEAPLVFALGSLAVLAAGSFWEHAVSAAVRLGRRAVLLTGSTQLGALPAGIRAFPYLPYSEVFPHAAAVVHQGGIGTLARAMRSGRPQVIVPVAFDQPDNARRTSALGVAPVIPMRRLTTAKLVVALECVLSTARYEQAATRLAADLEAVDGAARAADRLIAMLA